MNAYNELYKTIEKLIKNTDISSYQINKDTGVSYGNINAMRRGERSIENLTLKNAEKLYNYQKSVEKL
ncbi:MULTISPECIES: hypothetical protein [Staphylococcus]|uniref:hypothetical protein n=1 Tax=Staphylococcus TaxID=1279 RepID=UPI000D1E8B76|nr:MULTISPECIES: hypothetical protein [Staphylococcus]MCI2870712.1 hypothetical protein [Staphylococcus hominis]MCI2875025.1 hypothetical protein [Staphylococcus hominis]PTI43196.1 hypothetical protein BU062_04355 [Staphylococcus succinus]PTK25049.1 hypothetical protein BUZ54_07745 [Staphylococcus hominis]